MIVTTVEPTRESKYESPVFEMKALTLSEFLGELVCADNVESRAGSEVDTFSFQKLVQGGNGLFVWNSESAIHLLHESSHVVGDTALANTYEADISQNEK
jgi:hypothetical protein